MSKSLSVMVAAIVLLTSASSLFAFSFLVTGREEYRSGAARVAEMRGGYSLASGDRPLNVWLVAYDANGREVSRAQGRYIQSRRRWSSGVGDFRMVYYRTEFRVQTRNGIRYYRTPRYTW